MRKTERTLLSIATLVIAFNLTFAQDNFSDELVAESSQITVTGTVLDESTGKPLPGANVVIDGSDLGVASDEDGKFSIGPVETGSGITASMIGFETLTLYADSATISFKLTPETIEFSELEVLASRASKQYCRCLL